MMWGLDFLGGAKYPDLCVREMPEGWAFGCFYDTFGDSRKLIESIAATGRCDRIRVHLIWDDNHQFTIDDLTEAVKKAKNIEAIAKKFPKVNFQISPYCEHSLNAEFMRRSRDEIKKVAPSCSFVNTPLHNGAILEEEINEFHGAEKRPRKCPRYQFSFDGTAQVDADVEAYKRNYSQAITFFFWEPRFNGRWEDNDKTPRPERKGWPDSNLIDSVIYHSRVMGECKLSRDFLYKSHSENKGNKDSRAEKPVLICPKKSKRAELVTRNGQVVGVLNFYGVYSDGRWRFYASDWGYLIAEKASRIQGDPICRLRIDGKFYGTVNPAFRLGGYR